jgi:hypothetical protein
MASYRNTRLSSRRAREPVRGAPEPPLGAGKLDLGRVPESLEPLAPGVAAHRAERLVDGTLVYSRGLHGEP